MGKAIDMATGCSGEEAIAAAPAFVTPPAAHFCSDQASEPSVACQQLDWRCPLQCWAIWSIRLSSPGVDPFELPAFRLC